MSDLRYSDNDVDKRDIPSFIEPLPPLIQNPFMRPRPQKGVKLFEEYDTEIEEPELVQVYLRLKPCNVRNNIYEVRSDQCLVTSLDTTTAGHGRRTQHNVSKMYTFTKIFPPGCNQKEIFEEVVKDNLKKLPEGHNFTLLTYGASGSGKTYTLMGTVGQPGLVPRSLEYVFRLVDASQEPIYKPVENGADKLSLVEQDLELQWVKNLRAISAPLRDKYRRMSVQLKNEFTASSLNISNKIKHYVWVSFVEIYNEAIYDLLVPPGKRNKLRIREDALGHVYVKGAVQAFVRSGEEAYDVMVAGRHNLTVAATGVHAHSSRSHCVFTITMLTEIDGEIRSSCIRLCDLAGCERARATRNTGARMQESRAINSSLHVLERCLHMLRRNQRQRQEAIVPYRESKLTRLLGSGLSGARGEAVSMVVTVNPSPEYAHETKHVLGLAAVAQDIQINNTIPSASSMETLDSTADTTAISSSDVMRLKAENERLEFELMQSQDRYEKMCIEMQEKQLETIQSMKELVDNTEYLTKQYYEMQLEGLRNQMEEMKEDYEERLAEASNRPRPSTGSPLRTLQNKVAQLVSEKTALQEELAAERLARTRAEKQLQYILNERHAEERKSTSDSESDTDDPLNETLEPVLKKEKSYISGNNQLKLTIEISSEDDVDSSDDDQKSPNKSYIRRKTPIKCDKSDDIVNNDTKPIPLNSDESLLIKNTRDVKQSVCNSSQLSFDNREKDYNDTTLIKSLTNTRHGATSDNFSQLTFDDEKYTGTVNVSSQIKAVTQDNSVLIKSTGNDTNLTTSDEFSDLTYDDQNSIDSRPISSERKGKTGDAKQNTSLLIKSAENATKLITSDEFSTLTFHDENGIDIRAISSQCKEASNQNTSTLLKSTAIGTKLITSDEFSDLTYDDQNSIDSRPISSERKGKTGDAKQNTSLLIKSAENATKLITSDEFSTLTFHDENGIDIRAISSQCKEASNQNTSTLLKSTAIGTKLITSDEFSELTYDDEISIDNRPISSSCKEHTKTSNQDTSTLMKTIGNNTRLISSGEHSKLTFDDEKFVDNLCDNSQAKNTTKEISTSTSINNKKNITFDEEKLSNAGFETLSKNSNALLKNVKEITKNMKNDQLSNLTDLAENSADTECKTNKLGKSEFTLDIEKSTNAQTISTCNLDYVGNNTKPEISRGTYFIRDNNYDECKKEKDITNVSNTKDVKLNIDIGNKFTYNNNYKSFKGKVETRKHMVKTLVECFESKQDKVINVDSPSKIPSESMIINNIIKNLKPRQSNDSSLAQFEELEIATKELRSPEKKVVFGNIKILKDKRNFFKYGSESSDDVKENEEVPPMTVKKAPKYYTTIPETDRSKLGLKLFDEVADNNVKINKNTSGVEKNCDKVFGENQTCFDIKIEESAITPYVDNSKDALNNKSNLEKIVINVNSSIVDINNLNKKRNCIKETKIKHPLYDTMSVKSSDEELEKQGDKLNTTESKTMIVVNSKENNSESEINDKVDLIHVQLKEKRTYFENVDVNLDTKQSTLLNNEQISPPTIKDETDKEFKPGVGLLEETIVKPESSKSKHGSMDIFDGFSPCKTKDEQESIEKKDDSCINEINKKGELNKDSIVLDNDGMLQEHDTITAFEDIYKNISIPRVTEFDQLVKDVISNDIEISTDNDVSKETKVKFDLVTPKEEIVTQTSLDLTSEGLELTKFNSADVKEAPTRAIDIKTEQRKDEMSTEINPQVSKTVESKTEFLTQDEESLEDIKYNLRRKNFANAKVEPVRSEDDGVVNTCSNSSKEKIKEEDNVEKTERPRRNLRLRRRRNQDMEETDRKLKDIVNLQSEFCDVTLDKPVLKKEVKDIPSPEAEVENLPPDIQSCPSKSVTRSRRKLFTPRPEAIEESSGPTGDSNERIRVPRPSYHRTRVRRKL